MKKIVYVLCILVFFLGLPSCSSLVRVKHSFQSVSKVTVDELKSILDNPEITILDVRDVPDWNKSNMKIPNSIRETPDDVSSWLNKYNKNQKIIVYCA